MLIVSLVFCLQSYTQEYIFKFNVGSREEINFLTNIISIDNVSGMEVTAYANDKQLKIFKELGYDFVFLPHPAQNKAITMATTTAQMANWDRYPTYDVYVQMMNNFAANYPDLCQLVNIGTSEDGRSLLAVKISDNVNQKEAKPEFFYTSTMHGDETTGFILLLRLIDWLLSNYGVIDDATYLVDNFEIYINPNANPDGTYAGGNSTVSGATRKNSNGVDINRNFPDPRAGNHPDGESWQAETQAMMNFANQHNFVMSANFHGGIELINYPWDTWTEGYNDYHPHADRDWWFKVCTDYATSAQNNSPSGYFTGYGGVTNGGDWYVITGGRQDYMNYFHNCREVTIEVSGYKMVSSDSLPDYWNYNYQAMINYIKEANYGFNGIVTNMDGEPLSAIIEISGHDVDNSWVKTSPFNGDYYRPIQPGIYNVTYSSEGYISQNHSVSVSNWQTSTQKDVVLKRNVTLSGKVTNSETGEPVSDVTISFPGSSVDNTHTDSQGNYLADLLEGEYQVKALSLIHI